MKTAEGNDKLGKNCIVVSRPVGDTCPPSCGFLGNGCYAEATENQYKNARVAGFVNLITERGKIRSMMIDAAKRDKSIRFHERGDFNRNVMDNDSNIVAEKFDDEYVANVTWACESIVNEGGTLPRMWFYTHIYNGRLAHLSQYMSVYASVENPAQLQAAKAAGFTLFAWCDTAQAIAPKRPRGAAKKAAWQKALPGLVIIENERFITCPEIRKGRTFVTCSGVKKKGDDGYVKACDMCIDGGENVLFPAH